MSDQGGDAVVNNDGGGDGGADQGGAVDQLYNAGAAVGAGGMAFNYLQQALNGANIPQVDAGAVPNPNGGPPVPPPAPPPHMAGPPVPDLRAALQDEIRNSRKAQMLRQTAAVKAREGNVGHVFARHAPDLTDQQLQERLTTGLDVQGMAAPTSGVSSRFADAEVFFKSLNDVLKTMNDAFKMTRDMISHHLEEYAQHNAAFAAARANPGPGTSAAQAEAAAAFKKLNDRISGCRDNALGKEKGYCIPVYWNDATQRVELFDRYIVNHWHNAEVGTGFYGTSPQPQKLVQPKRGDARTMTLFDKCHAFNGPLDCTTTIIEIHPDHKAFGTTRQKREWSIVTHYPCNNTKSTSQFGIAKYKNTDT